MNINESTSKNLEDLRDFLFETAELDISQLGSEWEARRERLWRHAKYVDTYTLRELALAAPKVTLVSFEPPERSNGNLYAGPLAGEPG